jgi:hypothetical protein
MIRCVLELLTIQVNQERWTAHIRLKIRLT